MEKKKLLLVSVSVGLFLVIVIGVSILAFSPKSYSAVETVRAKDSGLPAPVSPSPPPVPPPVQVQPAVPDTAIQTTPPPAVPTTPSGDAQGNVVVINGVSGEAVKVEKAADARTVINIQNTPPVVRVEKPAPAKNAVAANIENVKPAKSASAPVKDDKSVKAPSVKTQTKPAKSAVNGAYWVQAGSFESKSRADNACEVLKIKGIASIVQDGAVNGKIYYRVRIGPYTTKNEADYWLSLVKEINGMQNSLIWKSGT